MSENFFKQIDNVYQQALESVFWKFKWPSILPDPVQLHQNLDLAGFAGHLNLQNKQRLLLHMQRTILTQFFAYLRFSFEVGLHANLTDLKKK